MAQDYNDRVADFEMVETLGRLLVDGVLSERLLHRGIAQRFEWQRRLKN
ncbi:MAG: hypothetical protein M2R45_03572 [Verrucomicrobia subdivision 3 bacterium]|nr:hypothetical protein [Limisphaerales bacterium]MCS1414795.1 hypothetical protein [Limisphaerales bacterium]